ncbi:hypothetical protein ACM66B_002114 [Microbotryomycetes sp. NB124-2]
MTEAVTVTATDDASTSDAPVLDPPASRLPLELIGQVVLHLQEPERSQLLAQCPEDGFEMSFVANYKRCSKLSKLALVSRQWHAIATQEMYSIVVGENWLWNWCESDSYLIGMDLRTCLIATDAQTMQRKLQDHGERCRMLLISRWTVKKTDSERCYVELYIDVIRACSSAHAVVLSLEPWSEYQDLDVEMIDELERFRNLSSLTVRVDNTEQYDWLEPEPPRADLFPSIPSLKRLSVRNNWNVTVDPAHVPNVEHLQVKSAFTTYDPFPSHPFESILVALTPNLYTLELHSFDLWWWWHDKERGGNFEGPLDLASIIGTAARLQRVSIGLRKATNDDAPELRATVLALPPTVKALQTDNKCLVAIVADVLDIRDRSERFKYLPRLSELVVTSESDTQVRHLEPNSDAEAVALALDRLQAICRERGIHFVASL